MAKVTPFLAVAALFFLQGAASLDPFVQYPTTDFCGPFNPLRVFKQNCPLGVCEAKRADCVSANEDRKQSLYGDSAVTKAQAYADAKSVCDEAAACVKSACSNCKPSLANGQVGCSVRSYHNGDCCWNSKAQKDPPLAPGVNVPWGPEFGLYPSKAGAYALDSRSGFYVTTCVKINGKMDLSRIVMGSYGARVSQICMQPLTKGDDPHWELEAYGQGPNNGGCLTLFFYDAAGHNYEAKLCGSGRTAGYVESRNDWPRIVSFSWFD